MQIREMTNDDVKIVAAQEKLIFSDPWTAQSFEESLVNEHAIMLVAEEAHKVAGYACIYHAMDEAELENIAVFSEYRQKGIGDALLRRGKELLAQMGVRYMYLEVRESNISAQNLYLKNDFAKAGIRKNFYDHPKENAWVMVCEIHALT